MGLYRIKEGTGISHESLVVRVEIPKKCPSLNLLFGGNVGQRIRVKKECKQAMEETTDGSPSASYHTPEETRTRITLRQRLL